MERVEETGPVKAFFQTAQDVFFYPSEVMARLPRFGSLLPAIFFAGIFAILISLANGLLVPGYKVAFELIQSILNGTSAEYQIEFAQKADELIMEALLAFSITFGFILVVTIGSIGPSHLGLWLSGVPKPIYGLTVRVICYTVAIMSVYILIPVVGVLLFLLLLPARLKLGLSRAHRVSYWHGEALVIIGVLASFLLLAIYFAIAILYGSQ